MFKRRELDFAPVAWRMCFVWKDRPIPLYEVSADPCSLETILYAFHQKEIYELLVPASGIAEKE